MEAPRNEAEGDEPSTAFTDLPNHIVTEILCRLPIKTVVAFKCVCKSWLNLVSTDTHLAESHRRRSATTELLLRPAASAKLYLGNLRFQDQVVIEVKHSPLFELPVFDLTSDNSIIWGKTERNFIEFVNSCNGLVCFCFTIFTSVVNSSSMHAVIANPVTGEFITVPLSTKWRTREYSVNLGLGFSVEENRFKLLQATTRYRYGYRYKQYAEICTFEKGSSSWRDVGDCPYAFSGRGLVFLEGNLHFGFYSYEDGIAYFDFEKELFGVMPMPMPIPLPFPGCSDSREQLGVFEGCLFVSRHGTCAYETWVMKEYGVRKSWTKVFCVPYDLLTYRCPLVPIKQLENGEILMWHKHDGKYLVSYDPVASSIRMIDCGANSNKGVGTYSPTLIRLKEFLAGYEACIHNVNSRRRSL